MIEDVFDNLASHIGQDVKCVFYFSDKKQLVIGKLKDVTNYKSVKINNSCIPFIGPSICIKSIIGMDDTILYNNSFVKNGAEWLNPSKAEELKKTMFGEDYSAKFKEYHAKKLIVKSKNVK